MVTIFANCISILSFISIPEQLIRPSPSIIGLVELITFVFVPPQRRHLIMGFFFCDEASLNYAFSPFYTPLDTSFAHPVLLLETPYRYTSY
jgi:hypothetical protein